MLYICLAQEKNLTTKWVWRKSLFIFNKWSFEASVGKDKFLYSLLWIWGSFLFINLVIYSLDDVPLGTSPSPFLRERVESETWCCNHESEPHSFVIDVVPYGVCSVRRKYRPFEGAFFAAYVAHCPNTCVIKTHCNFSYLHRYFDTFTISW